MQHVQSSHFFYMRFHFSPASLVLFGSVEKLRISAWWRRTGETYDGFAGTRPPADRLAREAEVDAQIIFFLVLHFEHRHRQTSSIFALAR